MAFTEIRRLLVERCLCPLGVEQVGRMAFGTSHDEIRRQVRLTMEMATAMGRGDFPNENFYDVRAALKRMRIENTCVEVDELFDLQRSLATICDIVAYLMQCDDEEGEVPTYPYLHNMASGVRTYGEVVRRIGETLDKYGHVKDSASAMLMAIRRELASTASGISRTLAGIVRTAKTEGLMDRDVAPTLRDGRLVIPVAPAMKRKIKGIVHDESDSGKTVFIEPAEVVEANNRIRELEGEERKEIRRILMELTQWMRPELEGMLEGYAFLAEIDFLRAKALFAIETESTEPKIVDKQTMDWGLAMHPLLMLNFKAHNARHPQEEPRRVVPLDLRLNRHQRLLVISGPNAGGKSVCLKTTGLVQYMLQCGMPVPVAKSSVMGVFRSIFIDIGDEQSIENDLSTYSSHLLNMRNMMRHADGASLVLIDEFGGGTEPQIGGAIAEAMLKRLNSRHVYGVITTHYQNLKHFAQETDGLVNGAMLYDRQQMRPLFQLSIGNPGSSFAIEIARKTGIPDEVIKDASEIVGKDYINADKYLQDIVRDKRYWESKRQAIHQHERQMEETIGRYEADIQKVHDERKAIIARAKEEAEQLLREANARIEQTVREIKEAQAEKERTRLIRQDFAEFKREVHEIDPDIADEKIRRQMEKLLARRKRKEEKKANKTLSPSLPLYGEGDHLDGSPHRGGNTQRPERVLAVGDYVRLKGQSTIGRIQKTNGKEAQVVFGSIVTNVDMKRLEPSEPPKRERNVAATFVSSQTQDNIRTTTLNFKQEIDVRGMRGDEAVQAVTYFIDDACVARASRVKILHGTGTGILKTLIRQYLATMPAVSDFYEEDIRFGGAGVTIVELV